MKTINPSLSLHLRCFWIFRESKYHRLHMKSGIGLRETSNSIAASLYLVKWETTCSPPGTHTKVKSDTQLQKWTDGRNLSSRDQLTLSLSFTTDHRTNNSNSQRNNTAVVSGSFTDCKVRVSSKVNRPEWQWQTKHHQHVVQHSSTFKGHTQFQTHAQ